MTNKERAVEIFKALEKNHINLYHDISKEDFYVELNKFLELVDSLDDIHFDAGMLKLFALFKDAHTIYFVNEKYVEDCICFTNNKYYYYDPKEKICEEISFVNGYDINYVVSLLEKMVSYECDSWKNFMVENRLRGLRHMQMIGCENKFNTEQIVYGLKSGKTKTKEVKKGTKIPNYSFSLLDNVLLIDYNVCRDMQDYKFAEMVSDIDEKCVRKPKACVVDLRYNKGGNNKIIYPLIDWLKSNNISTYSLINGGTFSSGVWAAIDLKHILNATLVGTNAGQAGHCYGECKNFEIDNKEFCCSVKYFNRTTIDTKQNVKEYPMDKIIDYYGPIKPDIYLEPKIDDMKAGKDGVLKDTLDIINNDLKRVCSKEFI